MTYVRLKKQAPNGTFNNLLENIYAPFPFLSGADHKEESTASVRVNIRDYADKYELNLVAPGFSKEDFEITLEKEVLTIAVSDKTEKMEEGAKYVRKEFRKEGFKRSFTVNENIDTENISAEYVNGILVLTLAKRAPVAPIVKSISIQ